MNTLPRFFAFFFFCILRTRSELLAGAVLCTSCSSTGCGLTLYSLRPLSGFALCLVDFELKTFI